MPVNGQDEVHESDELAAGYPGLLVVLSAIGREDELPVSGVRRLEVNLFASGDATYRYWTVYQEESEGGYLATI